MDTTAIGRCKSIAPQVNEQLKQYFETEDPPVFAIRDALLKLARDAKVLKKMRYKIQNVAINKSNRYGNGVLPSHIHSLIDLFLAGGTSREELGIPLAAQMPPKGDPMHSEAWEFIKKIIDDSNEALPPYDDSTDIFITTCTKTHSMQAIRCTALEHSHTPADDKTNVVGKFILDDHLNMGVVRKFRPELADICDEGIDFEVLVWPGEQCKCSLG